MSVGRLRCVVVVVHPTGGELLGRARELSAIALACESARSGHGSFLLVSGAPGAGKTALCEAASVAARSEGFARAWSSCWTVDEAPQAWPWHDLLGQLGGESPAGTGFAELSALADAFRAATADGPAVLVLDDLERADRSTLEATRFIAGQVRSMPLVVLGAHRPAAADGEVADRLADLARGSVSFELAGLDREDIERLLARHAIVDLAANDLDLVERVTAGNPSTIQRALAGVPGGPGQVRSSKLVRTLAESTVAGLGAMARHVGATAAILGPSRLDLLLAMSGADADHDAVVELELAGLVRIDAPDVVIVTHPAVMTVLSQSLGPREAVEVHARAVDRLEAAAASSPVERVRRASHALLAGTRSPADAERAVTIAVAVAADLAGANDHERAAAMLEEAVGLHRAAGLGRPPAALLAAHADAVLHCGRLAAARPLFEQTILAAIEQGDADSLARGALGLGGVWLNEHRSPLDRQRILGLHERAMSELGDGSTVLRARVGVRHAAELAYASGDLRPVRQAVERLRAAGDPLALAEALSLFHHLLLGPAGAVERRKVSEELVAVASSAGDGLFSLMGLMWFTVDLFLAGDPVAERSLRDLHERAEALPCASIAYVARAIDVMLQLRSGDFAGAEPALEACFEFGVEVGDADALAYYGSQLFALRWLQGRGHEVLEAAFDTAASPTLTPGNHAFTAAAACLAADAGDEVRAWAALDRLHASGLAAIPPSSAWLATLAIAMEAAHLLGDEKTAVEIAARLEPYGGLPVMGSIAVVCLGSCHRALGLAARVLGDLDRAVRELSSAVVHSERLGNRPMAAMSRADLAGVLLDRDAAGDRELATDHLREAVAVGERSGMVPRVEGWRARLEELEAPPAPPVPASRAADDVDASIGRRGSTWVLRWGDREVAVPDLLGMSYLSQLLTNPGREIPAATLVGAADLGAGDDRYLVLDDAALASYRERIRDLQDDLAEAEANHDFERAARASAELDAVVAEVSGHTDVRGRSRAFASSGERARTAVQKAVRRAFDAIEQADAELGAALRASVQTGRSCCYRPGPGAPARWRSSERPVA
jgi:hypothetical protein